MADLVESVRLMRQDEEGVVGQWVGFVAALQRRLAELGTGRLVKSLGDGVLLDFEQGAAAVEMALAMPALLAGMAPAGGPPLQLRIGLHVADVLVDHLDVYGDGVNLAARLASLARPGEVVTSAAGCEGITDGVEAQVTDLGDCFLKHWDEPVRAFRLSFAGAEDRARPGEDSLVDPLAATIAVVPFLPSAGEDERVHRSFGDAIVDSINARLARSPNLRVISRLSTAPLRSVVDVVPAGARCLNATFVMSGRYRIDGARAEVQAQLGDARTGRVVAAQSATLDVRGVLAGQETAVSSLVAALISDIARVEFRRVRALALPTLDSFSLYVGGETLLHRLHRKEFQLSREVFESLQERHPRCASPLAMLARWHLLALLQGWASDPATAGRMARDHLRRALDLESDNAQALAMDALLAMHVDGDLVLARARAQQAVAADPQEPQGWLTLAGVNSYEAHGQATVAHARRAIALSPLDPKRFMFDLLVAAGQLADGHLEQAEQWARSSLRRNCAHAPAHRLLVIALSLADRMEEAQAAVQALLRVDPSFTVRTFRARYPGRRHSHAQTYVQALIRAGVPH